MNIGLGRYGFFLLLVCSVTISACGGNGQRSTIPADIASKEIAIGPGNAASQQLLRLNKLPSRARRALALPSQCNGTEGPDSTITCDIYPGATLTMPASLAPPDPSPYSCTDIPPFVAYYTSPPPGLSVSLTPGATDPCFGTITATFTVTASSTATEGSFTDFYLENTYTLCIDATDCASELWNGTRYGIEVATPPTCITPGTSSHPCNEVAVTTANGAPALDAINQPLYRPDDGHDPAFFIDQGQLAASENLYALGFTYTSLFNFFLGAAWDEQRVCNGQFNPDERAYANVAIGLYAAAARVPLPLLQAASEAYAVAKQLVANPSIVLNSTYFHVIEADNDNEALGYDLYNSDAFNVCPLKTSPFPASKAARSSRRNKIGA